MQLLIITILGEVIAGLILMTIEYYINKMQNDRHSRDSRS